MGGSPPGTVATTTDEEWRSAFESVFLGAVRLARILAADLGGAGDGRAAGGSVTGAGGSVTGAGGSVVFVLASSVRVPLVELAIANGLFPGLAGVVKTMAGELGPAGIRVNGLLPVRIATNRVRELDALQGDPDEVRARLSEHIPLRRYGEPEEFGRAAAFVLSPAANDPVPHRRHRLVHFGAVPLRADVDPDARRARAPRLSLTHRRHFGLKCR